jgi:hypothetical protein
MKLLYTVAWPPQGIYVNKEIELGADMRGLKWRAYSPATAKIAELIGASRSPSRPPNCRRRSPPASSTAT